jgi:transcriptional regulator NrdR family protein
MSGFRCPKCNCLRTTVETTQNMVHRKNKTGNAVVRYRRCEHCAHLFRTRETVEVDPATLAAAPAVVILPKELPPNPYIDET